MCRKPEHVNEQKSSSMEQKFERERRPSQSFPPLPTCRTQNKKINEFNSKYERLLYLYSFNIQQNEEINTI